MLIKMLVLSFLSYSSMSQELFRFEETTSVSYIVYERDVRPGYSASLIAQGFPLGGLYVHRGASAVSVPTGPFNLEENLRTQLADVAVNQAALAEQSTDLRDRLATGDSTVPVSEDSTEVEETTVISWEGFASCAQQVLPLVKRALHLKLKSKDQPELEAMYQAQQARYMDQQTKYGFVCGQWLRGNLDIALADEVEIIKVLTTLLKRTDDERTQLYETLILAKSKKAPLSSKPLFLYYWDKLSFMAVMQPVGLPTYEQLNNRLRDQPGVTTIEVPDGEEVIEHQIVYNPTNLQELLDVGKAHLAALELEYE